MTGPTWKTTFSAVQDPHALNFDRPRTSFSLNCKVPTVAGGVLFIFLLFPVVSRCCCLDQIFGCHACRTDPPTPSMVCKARERRGAWQTHTSTTGYNAASKQTASWASPLTFPMIVTWQTQRMISKNWQDPNSCQFWDSFSLLYLGFDIYFFLNEYVFTTSFFPHRSISTSAKHGLPPSCPSHVSPPSVATP